MTRRPPRSITRTGTNDRFRTRAHLAGDPRADRHQRQWPHLRRLGAEPDGHCGWNRRFTSGARAGRNGRNRGDGVHRPHSPARFDFRLRSRRARRPHVHGRQDRGYRRARSRRDRGQGDRRTVHLRRAGLEQPAASDRYIGLSRWALGCGRDLVVAFGRSRSTGPAAGTARLILRLVLRIAAVAANRWRKNVERDRLAAVDLGNLAFLGDSRFALVTTLAPRTAIAVEPVNALGPVGTHRTLVLRHFLAGFGGLFLALVVELMLAARALFFHARTILAQHPEIMVRELKII